MLRSRLPEWNLRIGFESAGSRLVADGLLVGH